MRSLFLAFCVPILALAAPSSALTSDAAARLADLSLRCLHQEYPNKTGHSAEAASDAVMTPRQLHPSFYGCFDWHSSIHGHWMLVRLLKTYPDLPRAAEIRAALDDSFLPAALAQEADYFRRYKLANTFERTYGWAWLLKLDQELVAWDDPHGRMWHAALKPLVDSIVQLWTGFLPKQTYPNRTGVHPNTAFGLAFAFDWARASGNTSFEKLIVSRARDYYLGNVALAAVQEPDGTDFLSPSLEVADLMRRILPKLEFAAWFTHYLSPAGLANLMHSPVVSDRTDYQIVHLDGLSLSRAWCLRGIANALPASNPRRAAMLRASRDLIDRSLPHITAGGYGGEHWLASFALYALLNE